MNNKTEQPRCEHCRFWERDDADALRRLVVRPMIDGSVKTGLCRIRHPLIDCQGNTFWPGTYEDDWCGEFESKGDEQ